MSQSNSILNIGYVGENFVSKYLIKNNYKILERNYHTRYGEIDIIASDRSSVVFVDVKVRNINSFVLPFEAVDLKKQKKIIKTALIYLSKNKIDLQPRFDVIGISYYTKNGSSFFKSINHIKNAFSLEDLNNEIF